jgi:hypothetical protein
VLFFGVYFAVVAAECGDFLFDEKYKHVLCLLSKSLIAMKK